MAQYISRSIHCIVCGDFASHVTEYKYKDAEGYLCKVCNTRYIDRMMSHLDRVYPEIFWAHERTLTQMKNDRR